MDDICVESDSFVAFLASTVKIGIPELPRYQIMRAGSSLEWEEEGDEETFLILLLLLLLVLLLETETGAVKPVIVDDGEEWCGVDSVIRTTELEDEDETSVSDVMQGRKASRPSIASISV